MPTPIFQHNTTPVINVGHRSNGDVVRLNLAEISPLFITYPDKRNWQAFLGSVSECFRQPINIHWLFYLQQTSLSHWLQTAGPQTTIDTYIIDDPAEGTLKNRKKFVKTVLKASKPRAVYPKSKRTASVICIMDDIWDLIQKADRSDAQKIAALLRNLHGSPLYIIAGSSPGHRNLFPSLLKSPMMVNRGATGDLPGQTMINQPPTELILGTDGLVFRAYPGGQPLEKWYAPADWNTGTVNSLQAESLTNHIAKASHSPTAPVNIVPDDAQIYLL